jgi:glycosyltransferase involved in cell wall biosynthesis
MAHENRLNRSIMNQVPEMKLGDHRMESFSTLGKQTGDVVLATSGKFHAFNLAREFARLGRLNALFASHQELRPPDGVLRCQFKNRADLAYWHLIGSRIKGVGFSDSRKNRIFDNWMKFKLKALSPGILHGWNGCMNQTFRALAGSDWLRCVERSCPHNQFQYDILKAESDLVGVPHHQDLDALRRNVEELYLADVIICPSDYSANSYSDPALKKKLRRVSLGGNFPIHERSSRTIEKLRILMVGNSFLRKGTHYLIEAMKYIDHPAVELWLRGDVPDGYRHRISDPRIKIIPAVSGARLQSLYRSADVFIQASVDEGFGMTVLEALSFGLPLVITENVGARDILNDKVAVTVPIRSPKAIARAVPLALDLVGEVFDNERIRILNSNTWQCCTEQLLREAYVRT